MKPKPTDTEILTHAVGLLKTSNMYIVLHTETIKGVPVQMYMLFRRLKYASHGTLVGKRRTAPALLKLVQLALEVK